MSIVKKALSGALAAALACTMLAAPALAADGSYRVTVYGGNQGTVNGAAAAMDSVAAGGQVDFGSFDVKLADPAGKYYVKGIRPASDNNAALTMFADANGSLAGNSAAITEDTDFVVAYGIAANRTEFTVNYVDANGATIWPSQTFVGDVGDTPAATAPYIEGYIPQAYSITGTLSANAADNVFTFAYQRLPEGYTTIIDNGILYIVLPDGTRIPVPGVPAGTDGVVAAPDGTAVIADDGTPLAAPVDEMTIDDDENPLASGAEGQSAQASILGWLLPLLAACVAAAVIVFAALMVHRRRKEAEEATPAS